MLTSHYLKIELLGHAGTTPQSNLDPRTRLNFLPRIPGGELRKCSSDHPVPLPTKPDPCKFTNSSFPQIYPEIS